MIEAQPRVNLTLGAVFTLAAIFYVWTADTSVPMSLHAGSQDRYNLLASALMRFHLAIGRAPTGLAHLAEPYNPKLNQPWIGGPTDASRLNDDVLYDGKLYFVWGPAPALILLVPLHLLGFEPSASVTVTVYSIAGLGFALATLRVLMVQIGELPIWMCALAGLALALGSAIPFVLRTPSVSEDVLAGGYCFTMAGVWLATAALASRRASVARLVLMSLCFGLAAGSRPTLGLCAAVLIPVYLRLRTTRPRRSVGIALGVPIAVCFMLLLAYNQARFHRPLEIGSRYQLAGYDPRVAPIGNLSYALPGTWMYLSNPPQPMLVFPFVALSPPRTASPKGLAEPEVTGGLLPTAPIVAFVMALPWIWRRRPSTLGVLVAPLAVLAGAGMAMMLVFSYEFFAPTQRYEVDFATLFLLGGLAGWLSLSKCPPSRRRLLVRAGGGLLAVWACAAGLAASFFGYGDTLQETHPQTWRTLEDAGAPLSRAIDAIIGHPVLAASFSSITRGVTEFLLEPEETGAVTVVAPGTRTAVLKVSVELLPGTQFHLGVEGPGSARASYAVPQGGGRMQLPVRLDGGLNHLALFPIGISLAERAATRPVMRVTVMSLAGIP